MKNDEQPDWPPQDWAGGYADGTRKHGSTGQLWQAREGRWVRLTTIKEVAQPTTYHPVQIGDMGQHPALPDYVTLRAYEVYRHVHGEQRAMIEGSCRGGFGVGEVVAFLYARTFPKEEWSKRVDEALYRPDRR